MLQQADSDIFCASKSKSNDWSIDRKTTDYTNLNDPRRAVVYVACLSKPADKPCQ
jgi:hypothetical protein